jgi:hypothetical protein
MPESIPVHGKAPIVINFFVEPTGSENHQFKTFSDEPGGFDLQFAAELLNSAELHFEKRDFRTTVKFVEQALPAIDQLYSVHDSGKLRALKILRDAYLALNKGMEARDCVELSFAFFQDIIHDRPQLEQYPGI